MHEIKMAINDPLSEPIILRLPDNPSHTAFITQGDNLIAASRPQIFEMILKLSVIHSNMVGRKAL